MPEITCNEDFDKAQVCPTCGNDREWKRCWNCEDGRVNEFEADPLWYECEENAWEDCDICDGEGGWFYCWQCDREESAVA